MTSCTDVCEVVTEMIAGRTKYKLNLDDDNHDDIIEAACKVFSSRDGLLEACKEMLTRYDSQSMIPVDKDAIGFWNDVKAAIAAAEAT